MKSNTYHRTVFTLLIALFMLGCAHQEPISPQQTDGMVVAAHPQAAELGYDILKAGGNAVDAAVGTAIALSVVEPHASGLGGGGGMLIYLNDQDKLTYINYYPQTGAVPPDTFISRTDAHTADAVLVPGTVAGLSMALSLYGTMSWEDILLLSIDRLKAGFIIDSKFNKVILDSYEVLMEYTETSDIFLNEMLPFEVGDTLFNEPAMKTLQVLADEGPDAFYSGEIADSIVAVITRYGGTITKSDLAAFQAFEVEPLKGFYRDKQIVSAPPPQSGITLLEILNILENEDLAELGNYVSNDATLHLVAEAVKLGYADRREYLEDPRFSEIPVIPLISDEYAAERHSLITAHGLTNTDSTNTYPGSLDRASQDPIDDPNGSTTHLSIIDKDGNAVSLTQTLSYYWGSGISTGGFLLNNGMTSFSGGDGVNAIEPNKQPRSTISPTFIFHGEDLYLVIGTPGGGRIPGTMVQVITNILDYGIDPVEANMIPRFYSRDNNIQLKVESRFSEAVLEKLVKRGHKVEILAEVDSYFGGVHLIMIDPVTGTLTGSADPRRSGVVAGQ